MPPTPFPFQLGIGTDIVHVSRIKSLLLKYGSDGASNQLRRYLNRFMTYREQQQFWIRFEGVKVALGPRIDSVTRYLAGRWAAKEAAIKALDSGNVSFKNIQILHSTGGPNTGKIFGLVLEKPGSAFLRVNGKLAPSGGREHLGRTFSRDSIKTTGADESEVAADGKADINSASVPADLHLNRDENIIPGELQDDNLPGQIVKISISHDGDYAAAVCLAPTQPRANDVGGEAAAREL